jgi:hypothetical protein
MRTGKNTAIPHVPEVFAADPALSSIRYALSARGRPVPVQRRIRLDTTYNRHNRSLAQIESPRILVIERIEGTDEFAGCRMDENERPAIPSG